LKITTRQRVAILDRVLANPTLAPRRKKHSSGAYALSRVEANRATLAPRDRTLRPIELITTRSRSEGRQRFRAMSIDIGWGVGVPPDFWADCDTGPFPAMPELDMFIIAAAGRDVPARVAERIHDSLVLDHNAPGGVEPTISRFTRTGHSPGSNDGARSISTVGRWPLYYSDFPPNRELADQLSHAAEGLLVPQAIAYTALLQGTVPKAGFSLQVHGTHFPDTLGLQIESLLLARGAIPGPRTLRGIASSGWETRSDDLRQECARATEHQIDRILRRRVVGRVLPRFRSRTPIDLPRSGWFDFQLLTRERAAHESVISS
jgi:hypothetical protein